MVTSTTTLWRPVGRNELAPIARSDYREFPPGLAQQPIFYAVGVQLIGPPGRDDLLLALAAQVEASIGWSPRVPAGG